jgi:hypothetical protein
MPESEAYATYPAGPAPPDAVWPRSSTGETLLAVGSWITVGLAVVYALMFLLMASTMTMLNQGMPEGSDAAFPSFFLAAMFGFWFAVLALEIVGAILGLVGRSKIRGSNGENGHVMAIVGSAFMIPNMIGGGLALAGAIMCKVQRDKARAARGQPPSF